MTLDRVKPCIPQLQQSREISDLRVDNQHDQRDEEERIGFDGIRHGLQDQPFRQPKLLAIEKAGRMLHNLKTYLTQLAERGTILDTQAPPRGQGVIHLSFDDGPSPSISEELFRTLSRHDIPAAFAYIGENLAALPSAYHQLVDEGHQLINHSYHHRIRTLGSPKALEAEMDAFDSLTQRLSGDSSFRTRLYRPPMGAMTKPVHRLVQKHSLAVAHVTFYVHDADAGPKARERITEKFKEQIDLHEGGSIVLHEARHSNSSRKPPLDKSWLPEAIDDLISWCQSRGFEFRPYPEAVADEEIFESVRRSERVNR